MISAILAVSIKMNFELPRFFTFTSPYHFVIVFSTIRHHVVQIVPQSSLTSLFHSLVNFCGARAGVKVGYNDMQMIPVSSSPRKAFANDLNILIRSVQQNSFASTSFLLFSSLIWKPD